MALDRRNYRQLVDTTVEIANKVGGADIIGRIVEDLKDASEPYRKMVMETIDKVIGNLGVADIDSRLEEQIIDGIVYAFQAQVNAGATWNLQHGHVVDVEVKLDETFRSVPVPEKLGIPVLYKTQSGTGGDDSEIRSNAIVRFMADTSDGLAPAEWQYGGRQGPAPPVVLARKDQVPFSKHDFDLILEYMDYWMEEAREDEDHFTEATNKILEPKAFQRFVREQEDFPLAFLSLQFPKHSLVEAQGLTNRPELNGQQGTVTQYSRDRVGIQWSNSEAPVMALRPERLRLLQEPKEEPQAKRHQGTKQTEERRRDLERQEALQISKRFHECLFEDTFPEMGDLHLFGVGCDYKARATEVLAVWQGLVKHMDFGADQIAEALIEGNMQERFKEWTHKLAESRTPNSTYAKDLISANFAATEWDEL